MSMPRRCVLQKLTPIEAKILELIRDVEQCGASPWLTDTVTHLAQAADSFANWVDDKPRRE